MSKRFDSKLLLYVFTGLFVILFITFLTKIPREKSTLKKTIASFDTSSAERVRIKPRVSEGDEFEFFRKEGTWKIRQGYIVAEPRKGAVNNILNDLLSIRPVALAAAARSKWHEFDVTDSLGIRVTVENRKGRKLADVVIGRFNYRPVSNPFSGYGGGSVEGTSFVRLEDKEPVYSVDGFLTFSFSGGFDDWRNRELLRFSPYDVTGIAFTFPADSGFMLVKRENKWFAGDQPADSALTYDFLGEAGYTGGEVFADSFRPSGNPVYQAVFEGSNLPNITVKCYSDESGLLYFNSSLNPGSYFYDESGDLKRKLFKPSGYFVK